MKFNPVTWGIIGTIVLTGVLCWIAPAKADEIDNIRQQDVALYCTSEVRVFQDGFKYFLDGAAREIKNIPREVYEHESDGNPPLDGMYYIDFDKYTTQEQDWIRQHVYAGWDVAQEAKKLGTKTSDYNALAQKYYEQCAYNEAKRRTMKQTDSSMHKADLQLRKFRSSDWYETKLYSAASNERIIIPFDPNSPRQEHCTDRAVREYNACMIGK